MIYTMPKLGGSNLTWTVLGVVVFFGSIIAVVADRATDRIKTIIFTKGN